MRLPFLLIICLLTSKLYAESIDKFVTYKTEVDVCKCNVKGDDFSEDILMAAIESGIDDPYLLGCTYHCLGVYYYNVIDDYPKAITAYKAAINVREKHYDPLTAKSYRNLGFTYFHAKSPQQVVKTIPKAMDMCDDYQKDVTTNHYLSKGYRDIGDYEKALQYAHIALELGNSKLDKAYVHNNLAIVYKEMKKTENLLLGIKHAKEAARLFEEVNKPYYLAMVYVNWANILEALEQYNKAIETYEKALRIYKEEDPLDYADVLNNIAVVLNKQNKQNEAINLLDKSLDTQREYYSNATYHPEYSANYENLGDCDIGLYQYETAIKNYDEALKNLTDNPKSENPYIYNKPDYIRVLDFKAQALKMMDSTELAAQIYQDIDNWITQLYRDLSTNTSKLVWIERAHKIYGNAIEIALLNEDKERAFQYAEKAHAVLLWQNLSQDAALSVLREEDRDKRDHLIAQLHQAERQYQNEQTDIRNLRALEDEQEAFEAKLEKKYHPEYARRKYQTESTTVAQVKDMIDENTAFIEYYWTDDALQIFTITKDDFKVHTETTTGLADQIAKFQNIISEDTCYADCAKNQYNPLAFNLYKKLIPNEIQTNSNINRLVIVADKAIGTLLFSALATEIYTDNFTHDYPFLLKKYATNYLYSAGSFLQFQQENVNVKGFAGFAPIEYNIPNKKLLPLNEAGEEVKTIAKMYPSHQRNTYIRTEATKQNFIDALGGNYHTVLLATHAQYKHQKGEIAFQSEVMNQNEIDRLDNIRIQRLMLSACETAKGKQNAGEGILSLGWNFAYKGVPSITMTHWSVSEKATMQIMVAYNEALREGKAADQALQMAQINYLNGDNIFSKKYYQPYYWAAIVHAGNPDDTVKSSFFYMGNLGGAEWWVVIVLLLGLGAYAVVKR